VAGHETTSGLIGNCIFNLLRHRTQLERLQANPGLMANAVAELTRYDSSVQFCWRYIVDDVRVRDHDLHHGDMAFLCTGSANRDPARFGATADHLDITRSNAKEALSFGAGLHYCLGAHLARREAAVVLERLFRRFPGLAVADEPAWGRRLTFRSLEQLSVTLR
jgi:cytochrome P450